MINKIHMACPVKDKRWHLMAWQNPLQLMCIIDLLLKSKEENVLQTKKKALEHTGVKILVFQAASLKH